MLSVKGVSDLSLALQQYFFHVPAVAILHIKGILVNMHCRQLIQKEYLKKAESEN